MNEDKALEIFAEALDALGSVSFDHADIACTLSVTLQNALAEIEDGRGQ